MGGFGLHAKAFPDCTGRRAGIIAPRIMAHSYNSRHYDKRRTHVYVSALFQATAGYENPVKHAQESRRFDPGRRRSLCFGSVAGCWIECGNFRRSESDLPEDCRFTGNTDRLRTDARAAFRMVSPSHALESSCPVTVLIFSFLSLHSDRR